MKFTSIKQKILFLVLGMSLITLFVFGSAALIGLFRIRTQMQVSSAKLGEFATENSSIFLESEAIDKLMSKARDQSLVINEQLFSIAKDVVFFSNYIKQLYENADRLPRAPVSYTNSENEGKFVMQLRSPNGRADFPLIQREVELLGNITPLFESNENLSELIVSIYVGTETGIFISYDPFSNDSHQAFDTRQRPWYITAKERGGTVWQSPYIAVSTGKLVITCAHPFYRQNGQLIGVVGVDVHIENLNVEIIENYSGEDVSDSFILDSDGKVILANDKKMFEDYFLERMSDSSIKNRMIQGETGFDKVHINDTEMYIAYYPISISGWSLAVMKPVEQIMKLVTENNTAINNMTQEKRTYINSIIKSTLIVFILMFLFTVAAISFLSGKLSSKITNPILALEDSLLQIAGGKLDTKIEIKTGDEIERLGECVNIMAQELKEYIENIQNITAEKERIGAELNIATRIQASMLPCIFPPFPTRGEFDIFASMQPAKEVGGDFYDFFLVDENTLAVVIADVSGKGVPAALFMVITKTLIKNNAQSGKSPQDVFNLVNRLLCENNEAGMFVTAFMGYLDIPSGKFTYVNAGHNPPLIKRAGKDYQVFPVKPGLTLALLKDMQYTQNEFIFEKDDEIFLYTDGITEAFNKEGNLYTTRRLLESANKQTNPDLKIFLQSIKTDIELFADGAEQADDITMLVLNYKGRN